MLSKLNKIARPLLMLLLVAAIAALVYALHFSGQPAYDPNLKIAFIGTQKNADCIVLWQEDFAMMIDTGEAEDKEAVLKFLSANNITKLNYLVLTHPDKDHIGLATAVVDAVKVVYVVQPYYQKKNSLERNLQEHLAQNNAKVVIPVRVMQFSVNDATINILPPLKKRYGEDNNYSLAVSVRHRNAHMLFPGDAGDKRLGELLQLNWNMMDLYKLPQHGDYSEASQALFTLLRPANTVVTSTKADGRMIQTGTEWKTKWFYTVGNTVIFLSNGQTVQVLPAAK